MAGAGVVHGGGAAVLPRSDAGGGHVVPARAAAVADGAVRAVGVGEKFAVAGGLVSPAAARGFSAGLPAARPRARRPGLRRADQGGTGARTDQRRGRHAAGRRGVRVGIFPPPRTRARRPRRPAGDTRFRAGPVRGNLHAHPRRRRYEGARRPAAPRSRRPRGKPGARRAGGAHGTRSGVVRTLRVPARGLPPRAQPAGRLFAAPGKPARVDPLAHAEPDAPTPHER